MSLRPTRNTMYQVGEPPCDKCAYRRTCLAECRQFKAYAFNGKLTPPLSDLKRIEAEAAND